jgi:hypothetical protein
MYGKVLAVIVSDGDYSLALDCLARQTVKPAKTVFATKTFPNYRFVGERVGLAMRDVLSQVNLKDYQYLFRLDDDVVIPDNCIETLLNCHAHLAGIGGYIMLIRTSVFQKIFPEYPVHPCEDSMIASAFREFGYKVCRYPVHPHFVKPKKLSNELLFYVGLFRYRAKYNPVSLLLSFRDKNGGNLVGAKALFIWRGYLYALVHREPSYWFVLCKSSLRRLIDFVAGRLRRWIK